MDELIERLERLAVEGEPFFISDDFIALREAAAALRAVRDALIARIRGMA